MASGRTDRITVDPAGADVGPPATLDGVIDTEQQPAVRGKALDQQPEQDGTAAPEIPGCSIQYPVIVLKPLLPTAACDAQHAGNGPLAGARNAWEAIDQGTTNDKLHRQPILLGAEGTNLVVSRGDNAVQFLQKAD